jgi:CheY-like chemotaxis protein
LQEILAAEGFEVLIAPNGKVGLEVLATTRPDVVIVDYMMPVMDGLQMLAAMRQLDGHAETPVILMTAAAVGQLPPPQLWNRFMRKPLTAARIVKVVRELLNG